MKSAHADGKKVAILLYYGTSYQYNKEEQPEGFYKKSFDTTKVQDKQAFIEKLNDLVANPNSISNGDQLLIPIHAHGSEAIDFQPHQVALSNDELLDLNEIKPQLQTLLKRGVKIGVLDFSCFSKDSLSLKNQLENSDNLCVITGDSQNAVSIAIFDNAFLQQIHPQVSLEDAFLKARLQESIGIGSALTIDTPGISTPEGIKTQNDLDGIQEIMALKDWAAYDQKNAGCDTSSFPVIDKLSHDISAMTQTTFEGSDDYKKLVKDFSFFQESMNESLAKHPGLKEDLKQVEVIDGEPMTRFDLARYFQSNSYKQFMTHLKEVAKRSSPAYRLFNLNGEKDAKVALTKLNQYQMSDEDRKWTQQALARHLDIKQRYLDLFGSDPYFPMMSGARKEPDDLTPSYPRAKIGTDERKAYDSLYRSRLKKSNSGDACRDIKF